MPGYRNSKWNWQIDSYRKQAFQKGPALYIKGTYGVNDI